MQTPLSTNLGPRKHKLQRMEDIEILELHLAVRAGNVALVKFLLWTGANVNSRDSRRRTALHLACESEHEDMQEVVEVLLRAGAEVNVCSLGGETPLHTACRSMNSSAVITLLRHGAKIGLVNDFGRTPFHFVAAMTMNHATLPIVHALLANTITAEVSPGSSRHLSYHPGGEDMVSLVNVQDSFGNTALHLASAKNLKEVVYLLLRAGAKVGVKNIRGMTALHEAATFCAVQVVDVLVDNGEDINAKDFEGNTPLHVCFRYYVDSLTACRKLMENLLSVGAKVSEMNIHSKTPYEMLGDRWLQYDAMKMIEETFIKQFIRMEMLGLKYESDIKWRFGQDFYDNMRDRCCQELENMKSTTAVKDISLYEVLSPTNQPQRLSYYDLECIDQFVRSPDLLARFPLYGHLLRATFHY